MTIKAQLSQQPAAVPDVVAPPPHHPRFPLLDGMRAIAVLSVVAVHAAVFGEVGDSAPGRLLLHLNVGVTIFFLISGFLLYRPFIAHRSHGGPAPEVGVYARRRLLRILPAYWLVLLVLTVVPGLTGIAENGGLEQISLIHSLPIGDGQACVRDLGNCGLAHTWSLAVEFSFYAILPLYVLAAAALAKGRSTRSWLRLELLLLAALAIASTVARFALPDEDRFTGMVTGSVLGYFLWFALGMGLALISVAHGGTRERSPVVSAIGAHPGLLWGLAAAVYAALALNLPPTPFLLTESDQLPAFLAFGLVALLLILPAIFGEAEGGAPRAFLGLRSVSWLGLISYGVFLWHYAVTIELGYPGEGWSFLPLLIATCAITVPIAAASYYLLERPLLRFKR